MPIRHIQCLHKTPAAWEHTENKSIASTIIMILGDVIITKQNERNGYRKAWKICFALTLCADAVCSLFLNGMGGIGLALNNYEKAGYSLIASAVLLTAASALLGRGRMILPSVFTVLGTAAYIYPIKVLHSIPHELVPKQAVEPLAARIYPAVSVTVLLSVMIVLNFFSDEQEAKREKKRRENYEKNDRSLRDDEKIV